MIKKTIMLFSLVSATNVNAGLVGLTIHSRANCVNNESITWDARWYRTYYTASYHVNEGHDGSRTLFHEIYANWKEGWRSAAVDWAEAVNDNHWTAQGNHQVKRISDQSNYYLGHTYAEDCNIYDGWWDSDIPDPNDKRPPPDDPDVPN